MKKLLNVLLLCVLLSGCLPEDEEKSEIIYVAFATVENPNATTKFFLVLDNDTKLYTAEIGELADPDLGHPKDGRRVFVNYNVLEPASANNIKLKNLVYVPISGMTNNTTERNDRYRLDMLYLGAGYLNVLMSHNFSSSLIDKLEILLIRKDSQEEGTAHFDLIYNNGGDSGTNFSMSPICFDLSPLKTTYPDSVKLVISTYEESPESPKIHTMKYKWQ